MKAGIRTLLEKTHLWNAATAADALRKEVIRAEKACAGFYGKTDIRLALDMLRMKKRGFRYWEYHMFHLENRSAAEKKEYIPHSEEKSFIDRVNPIEIMDNFRDKAETYRLFRPYFKRDLVTVEDTPELREFCAKHNSFIRKERCGSLGRGAEILRDVTPETVLREAEGSGVEWILEELIAQHPYMAAVHPQSVNTVRITTMRLKDRVEIVHPFVKFGRGGSVVDNGGSGGLLLAVDAETGRCGQYAYTEGGESFDAHPDTGVCFGEMCMPRWQEAVALVRHLADRIPENRWTGWDLALTDDGWVLVEGNSHGAMVGWQLTLGKGFRTEMNDYLKQAF